MANQENSVMLHIGGDSSGAKKAINDVNQELAKSQKKVLAESAKSGRAAGDAYGRANAQATEKWLKVVENSLRQHGGRLGSIAANMIGHYDRISKARDASMRATSTGGGGGGGGAGSAAGTAALAAGAAAGTSAGVRNKWINRMLFGKNNNPNKGFGENIFDRIGFIANRRRQRDIDGIMSSDRAGRVLEAQAIKRGSTGLWSDIMYQSRVPYQGSVLASAWQKSGGMRGVIGEGIKGAGSLALRALPAVGVGLGAAAASIGGAAAGLSYMAGRAKENANTRAQINDAKDLIAEIEKIKDPTQQAEKAIELLGKDGQKAFRELKKNVKELESSLGSTGLQNAFDKAASVWGNAKDKIAATLEPLANAFGNMINTIMTKWTGMSDEMVEESRRTQAIIERNQKKIDAINAKAIEKQKEKEKYDESLKKEIKAEKDKATENERDGISLDKQKEELTSIVGLLEKKNRSLEEEFSYRKAINELAAVDKELNKQSADAAKDRLDTIRKEYDLAQQKQRAIEDQSRYSISDLAQTNSRAGGAARDVLALENAAKESRLTGNHGRAEQLINRANTIRSNLGMAGIITSSEYGDNHPITSPQSVVSLSPAERMRRQIMSSEAVLRYGDRARYGELKRQGLELQRQQLSGRKEFKSIEQIIMENGGKMPVQAFNSK